MSQLGSLAPCHSSTNCLRQTGVSTVKYLLLLMGIAVTAAPLSSKKRRQMGQLGPCAGGVDNSGQWSAWETPAVSVVTGKAVKCTVRELAVVAGNAALHGTTAIKNLVTIS
eukprot:5140-Heterococcus_DN1.PRE.1